MHLCSRCPVMSACDMQGWADASDSLAISGKDWRDRVPTRPATLPLELNIVCFFPAASIRSGRHTEPKQGG